MARHKMLEVDREKMVGVCTICGPVKVKRKRDNNGGFRYLCKVSQGRWTGTPESKRLRRLRYEEKRRGIKFADAREALAQASGQCDICARDISQPGKHRVDHDHATGSVRGILCSNCNMALGLLQDRPEIARGAAQYLERTGVLKLSV